jgi:hypothetical protein
VALGIVILASGHRLLAEAEYKHLEPEDEALAEELGSAS